MVSPASTYDKNYAFVLLEKVVKYLELSGFSFLADAAYDSSNAYSEEVQCNLSNLFHIVFLILAYKIKKKFAVLFNCLFLYVFFSQNSLILTIFRFLRIISDFQRRLG
ncbi:hypothetical protein AD60_02495 [Petrotoga sp. SL27]|nr:hypothetical protein AD60_02495 [Petrotoga sp. SL27]